MKLHLVFATVLALFAPLVIVLLARGVASALDLPPSKTPLLVDYFVQLNVLVIGYVLGRLVTGYRGPPPRR